MAFIAYKLTLNGSAQRLSDVLPSTNYPSGKVGGPDDVSIRMLLLQGHHANTARIFVGFSSGVSVTDYGFYLPIPTASPLPVPLGPFSDAGPMRLSQFWVIGTNAEVLQIGVIPF
jgi:hypothetical protein